MCGSWLTGREEEGGVGGGWGKRKEEVWVVGGGGGSVGGGWEKQKMVKINTRQGNRTFLFLTDHKQESYILLLVQL